MIHQDDSLSVGDDSALCAATPLRDFCRSHEFISSFYLFAVFDRPFNPISSHLGRHVGGTMPPKVEHRGGRLEMFYYISFSPHTPFIRSCLSVDIVHS